MKIRRVTTDGVRGLADRLYDFTHRRSNEAAAVVVITGPTASGKTSLLDAIAAAKEDVAPWGARHSWAKVVRADASAAKIRIEWEVDDDDRRRVGLDESVITSESIFSSNTPPGQGHDPRLQTLLERYDHDPAHGKVEYFFAERTLAIEAIGLSVLDPSLQKRVRLDRDLRKYGALHKFLTELHVGLHERSGEPSGKDRFAATFAKLCPTRRIVGLERNGDRMELVFDDGAEGTIPTVRLPHGEQQAALFAATFELLGLNRSLVLVDGPELHQTTAGAVRFAEAIAGLGVDNQVVFATGAPAIAEAFPEAVRIDLDAGR